MNQVGFGFIADGNSNANAHLSSLTFPRSSNVDTGSVTGSSDPNSAITANDFLSLLVTELRNQDPTQPTDPSSYIQQLVGVNSLEQLIQINHGLSALESEPTASDAHS